MPAQPWTTVGDGPHDVRLVVADMDGTLLTACGEVPEGFWPLLDEMGRRGVTFVPASGRQLATLQRVFERAPVRLSYVAENGTLVVHEDEVVSTTTVAADVVREVIATVRDAAAEGADLGLVLCGVRSAYVERADEVFLAEARRYYARLEIVEDLTTVDDGVLKLAAYDVEDAERHVEPVFGAVAQTHQVVVSGKHWIDVMERGVDKGQGVRALQERLGVTPAQTAIFGDYLNDLQMLEAGDYSFAMADAHPDLIAAARYLAPAYDADGVVQVLTHLLARP
ncbi:Cof-type HAD-IIB family hydrolase [Arsenicicoccus dermatophilus]|uniref:Cof-type HAD-IIB family hydrolase n=1 Tax=Arsenicicoccus dermatophilus TaxID=1076331 RepID=UPI003916E52E